MILALVASALMGQAASNVFTEVVFRSAVDRPDPFNGHAGRRVPAPSGQSSRCPPSGPAAGRGRSATPRARSAPIATGPSAATRPTPGLHGVEGRVEVAPYAGDNPLFRPRPDPRRRRPSPLRARRRHALLLARRYLVDGPLPPPPLPRRVRPARRPTARPRASTSSRSSPGSIPTCPPSTPAGANEAGFPWEKDYARIRPEYFDAADKPLRHLVDQGISPCIVGMWGYFLPWMGVEKAEKHWRYLIARYGALAGDLVRRRARPTCPGISPRASPTTTARSVHGWTEVSSATSARPTRSAAR